MSLKSVNRKFSLLLQWIFLFFCYFVVYFFYFKIYIFFLLLYPLQRNDPTIWIDWSVLTKNDTTRTESLRSEHERKHTHTHRHKYIVQSVWLPGYQSQIRTEQIRPRPRDADRAAYLLEKTERDWVSISSLQLKSRALRAEPGETIAHERQRSPTNVDRCSAHVRVSVSTVWDLHLCVCACVCWGGNMWNGWATSM